MESNAHRLCVAPMMDWTDRHCRYFHRQLAPHARLYTEMVHAQAVLHGDRERLLGYDPAEHPLALQLGGSEPGALGDATRIAAALGFEEINLNVGCPSDRVQAGRFGACLMREPSLVADCVAAMRAAVADTPAQVTVKCRLGVDEVEDYPSFRYFIDTIAQTGCTLFAVHARKAWLQGLSPKENREIPPLRYDWVYRLKRERPDLTVLINGGITGVDDALAHLGHVDGVMLGRVAYHDPYVLHRLANALSAVHGGTNAAGAEPVPDSIRGCAGAPGDCAAPREDLLLRMRPYVQAQLAHGVALKHMIRHVLGLFHGQPGGRLFRQVLSEGAHRADADWSLVERALAATRAGARQAA
ncbi:MAG TPA: tRNA dihydrouridine(20/20a) synthase DusA [Xanthomonadaceae bacterium]|nr:tRNA dihydrouridine(20/20a) synthase DusA [Xanthomonadaceae bacterium]